LGVKTNLESLLSDIREEKGSALFLFHGDDFQVHAAAQALLDALVPAENRSFNLERFDGRSASWDQIEAALMTPPFFPGTKLVWIENAPYFASPESKDEIGEKALKLLGEGRRDEAARVLLERLRLEGWTQERWERMEPRNSVREIAGLLGDAGKETLREIEALLEFCREQGLALKQRSGNEADRLAALAEQGLPPWGALLLTAAQVDRRMRQYKKVAEKGNVLDLAVERDRTGKLSREVLAQWLDRDLREAGKKSIDARAREMILARAGTDLRAFQQELAKLLLYVGDEPGITAKDVNAIFLDQGEGWIFDLTDALAARDAVATLNQLSRLMAQGDHPLKLLGPIAGKVRQLLQAREVIDGERRRWSKGMSYEQFQRSVLQDGAVSLPGHPYAAYLSFKSAENFAAEELARYLKLIYQADIRLKSSGNAPRIVMERLILEMCQR
jgi:DNA polymerase-3 subunit delta